MPTDKAVLRLDFGAPMRGPKVTTQGFLRLDAQLGRCGVNRYQQADGSIRRELRLPEEVFAPKAMESLAGAPLTYKHPPAADAWITRSTWRDHQIGFVGDAIARLDGDLVGGAVTVQDEKRVDDVLSGKLHDLSPVYVSRIDNVSGVHDLYGAYDCIQRNIVHNSVGIGERGWGRQGKDVAIRLDGQDAAGAAVLRLDASALGEYLRSAIQASGLSFMDVAKATGIIEPIVGDPLKFTGCSTQTWILESILDGWTPRPTDAQLEALAKVLRLEMDDLIRQLPESERRYDGLTHRPTARKASMQTIEIKLDGLSLDLPSRDADIVRKAIDARDAEIAKLKTEFSTLQARADGLNEKLTAAQKELTEAPAKVRAQVEARVALEGTAKRFEVKLDGDDGKPKTDRQLREDVVRKLKPTADLTGKDDAYVQARFDSAVEDAPSSSASVNPGLAGAARTVFAPPQPKGEQRQDSDDLDAEKIRREADEKRANAWKPKT